MPPLPFTLRVNFWVLTSLVGGVVVVVVGGVVVVVGGGAGATIFIDAPVNVVVIAGKPAVDSFIDPEIPIVAVFPVVPVMVKPIVATVAPEEPAAVPPGDT
jgi:hypothetical protein